MSTAYITKRSFNLISSRLIQVIATKKNTMLDELVLDFPINNLVDSQKLSELLNNEEIGQMFTAKKLFENFAGIIAEIQQNQNSIKEIIHNQNRFYMNDVKMPAYHTDDTCEAIHSGFFNIAFPLSLSGTQVNEAKAWAKKQPEYDMVLHPKTDPETFQSSYYQLNSQFKQTFCCKADLKIIEFYNSGTTSIDNKPVEDLVEDPFSVLKEEYLKKYTQLRFYFDGEFADKLRKLVYMPHYKMENYLKTENNPEEKKVIHEFHEVKRQLIHIMTEAFQKKYNFNFSIESEILEALGFRACKRCNGIHDITFVA